MSCDLVMFQDEEPFCSQCYLTNLQQIDQQSAHEKSVHKITTRCLDCGYEAHAIINTNLPPVPGFPRGGLLRVVKRKE